MTDLLSSRRANPAKAENRGLHGSQPGRCVVMGILNVTPDSFSDGNCHYTTDAAVAHGFALAEAGADYVDVGGESTRPGARRIPADIELSRVLPVVRTLAASGVRVSIDTTRSAVAEAAVDAGAVMINDVSGGLADAAMADTVRSLNVPWVLMHWRGHSQFMEASAHYRDVVAEVRAELLQRVEAAVAAGVDPAMLILDPGLGFAKNADHDLALLNSLSAFVDLGLPVLLGASRKRFLARVVSRDEDGLRQPAERDAATLATSVMAAQTGAWGVRVHEVKNTVDAVRVVAAVCGKPGFLL